MRKNSISILRLAVVACSVLAVARPAYAHGLNNIIFIFNVIIYGGFAVYFTFLVVSIFIKRVLLRRIIYSIPLGVAIVFLFIMLSNYIPGVILHHLENPDANLFAHFLPTEFPAVIRIEGYVNKYPYMYRGVFDIYYVIAIISALVAFTAPMIRQRIFRNTSGTTDEANNKRINWLLPLIITLAISIPAFVYGVSDFATRMSKVYKYIPYSELETSIKTGDINSAKKVLKENPDILKSTFTQTIFFFSLESKQPEMQEYLLSIGMRPSLVDAAQYNKQDIVKIIFKEQPEILDTVQFVRAEIACVEKKQYGLLELLATYKTPYTNHQNDARDNAYDCSSSSIYEALEQKDMRALRIVAPHSNVNINLHKWNDTLLHQAIKRSNMDALAYLLTLKPNVDILSENLNTPLHFAIKNRSLQAIQLLLDAGAKVNNDTMGYAQKYLDANEYEPLIARLKEIHAKQQTQKITD